VDNRTLEEAFFKLIYSPVKKRVDRRLAQDVR
jgi:hypothetical protein